MADWRTDIHLIPESCYFDAVVIDAQGQQYRITDCMLCNRQVCEYDSSWGWESVEHNYSEQDFRRVTHWMIVELPDK